MSESGYYDALVMAGAQVLAYKEFGSWQGDWWALVKYKGKYRWVHSFFGSCSGCDAFQNEFYCDRGRCDAHQYEDEDPTCVDCGAASLAYQQHLREFGAQYLKDLLPQKKAIAEAREYIEWDAEASDMVKFIKDSWETHVGGKK